jgi:predicted DNA binding protein
VACPYAIDDPSGRSAAFVSLVYWDTTYGILAVYSTRPLAFSRREQDGFESLGDAIGFVINAVENRQLLFADTIVELEFEVTDEDLVFVRVSDRLGCELTITGFVESEDENWSVYALVDGASPTEVRDVAADDTTTADVRVITDEGDHGLLEFVLAGRALEDLTEHGAILTSGHVDDGTGRFCVETHQTADTRALSSRLQTTYPDSTLVAHREFERPAQKATEVRRSLDGDLTDRQQEALERAYLAGYFDWPRTSNAADVSETMGVSETTFHYHLRNALDTLVANIADLDHPGDGYN